MKQYKYDAFISYRHTEPDRFAAENLHRQMEAFRLPGKVFGKSNGKTRIERVFRDKDELPLTNNLEDPIMEALEQSEYLIVICSPRLRESLWCRKEIENFIRMHGREKVLAVLIEGEPEDSFPEELLYVEEIVTEQDGSVRTVRKAIEPLAADIRGKNRREMLKALKTEKFRLLAPMFSLNYDDLRQRHRERRLKRILAGATAAAAVCLGVGTFSTMMALRIKSQNEQLEEQKGQLEQQANLLREQADEIRRQNDSLLADQALNLAQDSLELLEKGDRIGAVETAITSLTEYEGLKMPYTAAGEYALTESLHIYDNGSCIKPRYQMETDGVIRCMRVSPDGEKLLTCDAAYSLILWDITTGSRLAVMEDSDSLMSEESDFVFLDDDRIAYFNEEDGITVYKWRESVSETLFEKSYPRKMAVSGNLFAVEFSEEIGLYRTDTLECIASYPVEDSYSFTGDIFPDGESGYLAFMERKSNGIETDDNTRLVFWNGETGECKKMDLGTYRTDTIRFSGDTAYVLSNSIGESYDITEAKLMACNVSTGEINWSKKFDDCFGSKLFLPCAEGADKLLMASSYETRLIGMTDGKEYARFSMGSNIAGGGAFVQNDLFIVFTRSGDYHTIIVKKLMDYQVEGRFQSHSRNVKDFMVCASGFLVLPYQDNRVTLYTYSGNEDYEALENSMEIPEAMCLRYIDAVEFAEEKGLENPALVSYIFFSEDESVIYVCYNNSELKVYDGQNYEKKAQVALKSPYLFREYGVDARGNRYVGGSSYGYMLNPDFELLAVVENLVWVDFEQNRFIVEDSAGEQFWIPIYTTEELLDNASAYVLSLKEAGN